MKRYRDRGVQTNSAKTLKVFKDGCSQTGITTGSYSRKYCSSDFITFCGLLNDIIPSKDATIDW